MPSEVVCLSVVHTLLGRVMCKQTCERLSVELRTRETLRVQSLEDFTAIPSTGVVCLSVVPTLLGRAVCEQPVRDCSCQVELRDPGTNHCETFSGLMIYSV